MLLPLWQSSCGRIRAVNLIRLSQRVRGWQKNRTKRPLNTFGEVLETQSQTAGRAQTPGWAQTRIQPLEGRVGCREIGRDQRDCRGGWRLHRHRGPGTSLPSRHQRGDTRQDHEGRGRLGLSTQSGRPTFKARSPTSDFGPFATGNCLLLRRLASRYPASCGPTAASTESRLPFLPTHGSRRNGVTTDRTGSIL